MATKCTTCNETKASHYGEWCPRCDEIKPEPQLVAYDFIRVLQKFCRLNGYKEHGPEYDQIWHWACDWEVIKGNDTYSTGGQFYDMAQCIQDDDENSAEDLQALVKEIEEDEKYGGVFVAAFNKFVAEQFTDVICDYQNRKFGWWVSW